MMDAIRRLGVMYGRLGLSTDPALVGRRADALKEASNSLTTADIAPLVQAAFDIGTGHDRFAFLSHFQVDPTFGVESTDREATLLAAALAEHAIEGQATVGGVLALTVTACACDGLREPPLNDQLVASARRRLAAEQGRVATAPRSRTYSKQPDSLTEAIAAIPTAPIQNFSQAAPNVRTALAEVGKYAEACALAAASSDNDVLAYAKRLEQEMQVYWWVTGGWSDDTGKAYRRLPLELAAICGGKELAGKHPSPMGLFAAPALINLLLERGRQPGAAAIPLYQAAVAPDLAWRRDHFAAVAAGPLAAMLPVTTALGLSAASEDADDWKPRHGRLTGLAPDAALPAAELGLQLYRERLVVRALD